MRRSSFVAGLILDADGRCIKAAPILAAAGCKAMTAAELRALFARRGWQASIIRSKSKPI